MDDNKSVTPIKEKKPWYKKGGYIGAVLILVSIILASSGGSDNVKSETKSVPVSTYNSNIIQPSQPQNVVETKTIIPVQQNTLSNDNYYTNTAGNTVHSPAYSNSVPAEASARCGDGTYSFSQSRRGTCSHHGGVSEWL